MRKISYIIVEGSTVIQFNSTTGLNNYYTNSLQKVDEGTAKGKTDNAEFAKNEAGSSYELTPEEQKQVEKLKARDREVKAHERAHLSAGGSYVRGTASYSYQRGPDGHLYAIGGEVSIDTSKERTPEETISKAQIIRRAALAPAKPSSADRAVAAKATKMEQDARREISKKATEEKQAENYKNLGLLKNYFPVNHSALTVNILV
jgi:hypothetical protein